MVQHLPVRATRPGARVTPRMMELYSAKARTSGAWPSEPHAAYTSGSDSGDAGIACESDPFATSTTLLSLTQPLATVASEASRWRQRAYAGSIVVLMAGLVIVGYSYSQSTSHTNSLSSSLTTLRSQLSAAQSSISELSTNASSLQALVSLANSTIAKDASQIALLKAQMESASQTISTLNAQGASATAKISALEANVTSYKTSIALLQSQQASLQTQITTLQAIANLASSKVLISNALYNVPHGAVGQISQFTADYSGYVLVVGTANSTNLYIAVDSVFAAPIHGVSGLSSTYQYGAGGNYVLVFPITPGSTILALGSYDTKGTAGVRVTVTYFY